jgi:hypothetical protein
LIVIVTILSLSCMPVELHAGAPKLHKVSPQVGQRGTSIDVELRGLFLNDLQGMLFYEPGISVDSVTPITEEVVNGKTIPVPDDTRLSIKLNISDKTCAGCDRLSRSDQRRTERVSAILCQPLSDRGRDR